MMKKIAMGFVACALSLTTGCDSANVDQTPFCSEANRSICAPPGFPLVNAAGFRSDACPSGGDCAAPLTKTTASLSQPETGKLCMKGTVAGRDGFAWLLLQVDQRNMSFKDVVEVLDAKALGITELRFTIDGPPAAGLSLFGTAIEKSHCEVPGDCYGEGWNLMTGPRSNLVKVIDTAGPVSAPFANFARVNPNEVFNTAALGVFIFVIGPGDYDFCISDFKWVDAQGNVVNSGASTDAAVSQG
jgi:hypothetical protein